jgi:uncharacterized membrane protein
MSAARPRLTAVDALRGLVMVIMALDHTRDFLHADAMQFAPENLARTTPAIFLTRWVTHICAPVFVLTAGMGARLRLRADNGDAAAVSRFLWTRGLWLIAIELTVMRLAMNFSVDSRYPLLLLILWALGWSMIALAALVHVPARVVGLIGAAIVVLHNTLDGVRAADLGGLGWLWRLLHEPGLVTIGSMTAVAGYPVLPWVGVMALGFWIAGAYDWPAERRLRAFRVAGAAGIAGFLALRLLNGYGDPAPWSVQPSPPMTLVSLLNATKYPPSLSFLLMTLGPALPILAAFERPRVSARHPFVVFGRVPFAYYVVHFWLLHVVAAAVAFARYGAASFAFLWYPLPSMGGPREIFPPDLGVSLVWTYVAWALLVVVLYWPARWLADIKAGRKDWWLGYV